MRIQARTLSGIPVADSSISTGCSSSSQTKACNTLFNITRAYLHTHTHTYTTHTPNTKTYTLHITHTHTHSLSTHTHTLNTHTLSTHTHTHKLYVCVRMHVRACVHANVCACVYACARACACVCVNRPKSKQGPTYTKDQHHLFSVPVLHS